ncbi:MAG: sugar ABC transporter ATP-binding protein [Lentisphaeria bacterium]|nr:sugar ABC transporter ATP-binding protein [Lentisphaeria bacterium]
MPTNDTDLVLEAKGLKKSFGGNAVLKGVDLALRRGEVVLLQGANGSGKTTLLNILTGNLKPDGGSMHRHEPLGRTWQDVRLFATQTLADNIAMAKPKQFGEEPLKAVFAAWKSRSEERLNEAETAEILKRMGLAERAAVPGADAKIAEAKFAAMVRALRAGAKVLFLDEPLAGLDHAEIDAVIETLRTLVKEHGLTLVIIEHALNIPKVLRIATTIWTLKNGLLTAGAPDTADEAGDGELHSWLESLAIDGALDEIDLPGGAHLTIAARRKDAPAVFELTGCKVSRGARPVIAEPISFILKEGDLAVLEAPNGWGKSTLLETIAGLIPTAEGRITLFGADVTAIPVWKRAHMGLRLNRAAGNLFTQATVRENARLNHVAEPLLPNLADRKAGTLSGGESRRLSFEAVLNNPEAKILMLDEPFQALDITESARVRRSLSNCNKTILVTVPKGEEGNE